MKEVPILKHPEVKQEEDNLKEGLEIEQLVYDYKIKQEEMLSIFDEVKQGLRYKDIVDHSCFSILPEKLQEQIGNHAKKGHDQILYEDFNLIWNLDKKILLKMLARSLREEQIRKIADTEKIKNKKERKVVHKQIKLQNYGKTVRLGSLLNLHFDRLQDELSETSDEDLEKIKAYRRAVAPPAKKSLRDIKDIMDGIRSAKESKSRDILRKPSETAAIYKVKEDRVNETNILLEEVFKEEFDEKLKIGVKEKFDELGNIVDKDFVSAYVNYKREMVNLYNLLQKGTIVETGYIKKIIETAMPFLEKNPPSIVYFHGDFGTGKTALAVHIARTRFLKEPIVVAGSKFIDPDRFTEEFKLQKLSSIDFLNQISKQLGEKEQFSEDSTMDQIIEKLVGKREDIREKIVEKWMREEYVHSLKGGDFDQEEFEEYMKKRKDEISEEKINDINTEINSMFSNSVQGRYVLGAMFQAMKEGKPLIIDEANAISPDVLIAFNDLLTKKTGKKIKVRSDEGEIKIKEGFCIMWTGNTGERYKNARYNDMDPASYSRITPIQMNYLPQSREADSMNQLMERLNLKTINSATFADNEEVLDYVKKSKTAASGDQIFQVNLLKLLNKRLGAHLLVKSDDRYSVVKDIYRLSVGSRMIMDLFEKKLDNISGSAFSNIEQIVGSSDPTVIAEELKKTNLTMRELIDNIIGGYLDDGCSMDIEYYLWNYIKKQDMHPKEQAIVYSILNKVGFFNNTDGKDWVGVADCTGPDAMERFRQRMEFDPIEKIDKYEKIEVNGEYVPLLNTNGEYQLEYFSSIETMQLLFGYLPPRKKKEYEEIMKKKKEVAEISMGEKEKKAKREAIIRKCRDLNDTVGKNSNLFESLAQVRNYRTVWESFSELGEEKFIKEATDDEYYQRFSEYVDAMVDFWKNVNKITEEEAEEIESMSAEEKADFLVNKLKGI